ncbi:N-acetylmuramoyl-L-alanine amidase [Acidisarcina polymorpha]|uniref:N-acetylmuramoyl-L-alanine amidase n=1 Tax=Acidisarcina polymorpha TaxID=2211140 RepID=A0A2Z5G2F6_9BACT|nr:N-acetylmuramoyl-L-alanine amidase [Acidisarcina polymorpha]AXC13383.1 N-acetylmuramoyl-L-alanine amidase [Acidisarcina polymorpha]
MRLPNRKITAAEALARAERSSLLLILLALLALPGFGSPTGRPTQSQSPFDRAQRARQALASRPEEQRSKRDYERVLELYRFVYHADPASPKADASVFAVAQLLGEEGRVFNDEKSLHDALGQYEFLRREYPGSRYRPEALFAEADLNLRALDDRPNAKAQLQSFLKQYPHSPFATQAHQDLKDIHTEEQAAKKHGVEPPPALAAGSPRSSTPTAASRRSNTVLTAAMASQSEQAGSSRTDAATRTKATPSTAQSTSTPPPPIRPAAAPSPSLQQPISASPVVPPARIAIETPLPFSPQPVAVSEPRRNARPVSVTGVRHWSTAIYTRVAIDLGDEVQYEAARVPDPDRIFFDLHGAKLSPELIGKSVTVTDDGFLKRIRVAQFSNDVTRIVLDVSDVSDYSAFLLPNPYRLIIDIHGRKPGTANTQIAQAPANQSPVQPTAPASLQNPQRPNSSQPVSQVPSPSKAPPSSKVASSSIPNPVTSTPSRTAPLPTQANRPAAVVVPGDPATSRTEASQDIASLSRQPDRIKATSHPTTAPIAASVAGTTPAAQPDLTKTTPARTAKRGKDKDNTDPNAVTSASIHEADPTAAGGRSMVRALGLKIGRIVVDAGHGGHDSGTLGPDGIQEKDVVLDVSLRLGKLLKQRLGADVIFTRSDDTFIPLETRTAIANKAQADLFVSVHANSSLDASARGVETYYLNFTASPESLELAARENAVSQQSIHQLSDLVKKIALHDKIDESREFASDVQKYLYDGLDQGNPGLKDRGVKQAPFVVLIGANMPSILAEISFLTNPDDARQLRDPSYRQRIAESLYRGVARYVSGLSGVRLAENSGHLPGD